MRTPPHPGWSTLKKKILSLDPTGPRGFEGLVAGWLSRLLNETFYVAATGRQRLGDAASHSLETAIQAKLYRSARLQAIPILGDLVTLASHLPDLQVYVLMTTANLSVELYEEISSDCSKEGIDFVSLTMSDNGPSDLGILSICLWAEVTSEFLTVSPELTEWILKESRGSEIVAALEHLRARLTTSIESKRRLVHQSQERLQGTLFDSGSRAPVGTSIDVHRLIERRQVYAGLDAWWTARERPLLVVGEEGLGKSWSAASWLRLRGETLEVPVVWLDSHRWQGIQGLEGLAEKIASRLSNEALPQAKQTQRLLQKLAGRWPAPACLVILDGANEGRAPEAARQILTEYLDSEGRSFAERYKLLITMRPESGLPARLRSGCARLEVPPFTPDELEEALRKASGGQIGVADLPESLREIARRARYLELAIQLRDQFGSISVVTVETILFARLNRLLEDEADFLGVGRGLDVFEQLVRLMSSDAGTWVLYDENALNQLVPNGARALKELQDVGWIREIDGGRRVLTETHVRLAWALFFLRYAARQRLDSSLAERIENLRTIQEPGLDDDLRSSALGTALDLLTSGLAARNEFATEALLGAWVLSHNSRLEGPHFATVLQKEPGAYCRAIEALMLLTGEVPWEEQITKPLAESWRRSGAEAESLRPYLDRWLLFVWNAAQQDGDDLIYQGVRLPRAPKRGLLKLEQLAIAVLSQRSDSESLLTLCRQAGSWDLTRDEDGMPYKDHWRLSGALLRWNYGEEALPELERISNNPGSAPFEVQGAKRLAQALYQSSLPTSLHEAPREGRSRPSRLEADILALRAGKTGTVSSMDSEQFGSRRWSEEIAVMAADGSVPGLDAADVSALTVVLDKLAKEHCLWSGPAPSGPDRALDVWLPWLARLSPQAWSQLLEKLIEKALNYTNPHFLLISVPALLPWPAGSPISERLPRALRHAIKAKGDAGYRDSELMQVAIHLEDERQLTHCLKELSRAKDPAFVVNLYPLYWLLRCTITPFIFEEAERQLAKKLREPVRRFWLAIQAGHASTWPTEQKLDWFKRRAKFAEDSDETRRLLLDFLLNIAHPSALRISIENEALRGLLELTYFQMKAADWSELTDNADLPFSYEYLLEGFLIQSVGPWLFAAGRTEDFHRWGKDIFAAMTARVEENILDRSGNGRVEWLEGSERRRALVGKDDRGFFEADFALQTWAREEPDEFIKRLRALLEKVRPPYYRFDGIDGFMGAVAEIWLEVEPSQAYTWLNTFREALQHAPTTNDVPSMIYHLWNLNFCNSREHQDLRLHLLRTAKSDAEIAGHVLAARMHRSLAEIDKIVEIVRVSHAQIDRALAVSVLAWHPQGENFLLLMRDHDPSLWVRNHAAWAHKVCRKDQLGRDVYRQALSASDVLLQQAQLQILAPLITPTFGVWHFEDQELQELRGQLSPQRRALLIEFKDRAKPQSLGRIKISGREIAKYCRGEDVSNYTFTMGRQLFPWW